MAMYRCAGAGGAKYARISISGTTNSNSVSYTNSIDVSQYGIKKILGVGIESLTHTSSASNVNMDTRWYSQSNKIFYVDYSGTTVTLHGSARWDYGLSLTWTVNLLVIGK